MPGGVEQLQNCQIPGWAQLVAAGLRFGPCEEPLGLAPVEVRRQPLLQLGYPGRAGDVVGDSVMFLEIAVEAPHRRQGPRGAPLGEPFPLQLAEEAPEPQPIHRLPLPACRSAGRRTR